MSDTPLKRLDPQRLQSERDDVDLGETETAFNTIPAPAPAESELPLPVNDETIPGAIPPAR